MPPDFINPADDTHGDLLAARLEAVLDHHRSGRVEQAEALYRSLLEQERDCWQIHFNFGLLLFEQGRCEAALEQYRRGLSCKADNTDLLFNTAICEKALGLYAEAIRSYHRLLAVDPEDTEARYNLAGCYCACADERRGMDVYRQVLERDPGHLPALRNLAHLCHRHGLQEEALHLYNRICALAPDDASADHLRAALSGADRTSMPVSYVREVFDEYADHYEHSLVDTLSYHLPDALLETVLARCGNGPFSRVLDLGCGTGLAGKTFAPHCEAIIGVELAEKMAAIARQKGVYDEVVGADLMTWLEAQPPAIFDLQIAADVLPYFGALEPLFVRCLRVARAGGSLFFSVEDDREDCGRPVLTRQGRFAHGRRYLERIAARTGWQMTRVVPVDLRREQDGWVRGSIYGFERPLHEETGALYNPADEQAGR